MNSGKILGRMAALTLIVLGATACVTAGECGCPSPTALQAAAKTNQVDRDEARHSAMEEIRLRRIDRLDSSGRRTR